MNSCLRDLRGAVAVTFVFAALLGGVYPLVVFVLGQAWFPEQIRGSLIRDAKGTVVGSRLIGQGFTTEKYFHPRPSAAGANGYDAANSSGSNLGPTSQKLRDAVAERVAQYRERNHLGPGETVPPDAVTASGSGLDPHISLANAERQADRVARARGWEVTRVRALIEKHTQRSVLPFLGPPAVNVLTLNLDLDRG